VAAAEAAPGDGAVHEFWTQVKREYAHDEFIRDDTQEGYGIGVLYLDRATPGNPSGPRQKMCR
jgi:hypothetical protein